MKTTEERIAALESAVSEENLRITIGPIVAEAMVNHAGAMVKLGAKQVAAETVGVLLTPFIWIGDKVSGLFTKPEPEAPKTEPAAPAAA